MTMYGAPLASSPTSMTRATCSLWIFTAALRLADEARDGLGVAQGLGKQELERDRLVELKVMRRDHDAHAALAEHPLDAVLVREDVADLQAVQRSLHCHARGHGRLPLLASTRLHR